MSVTIRRMMEEEFDHFRLWSIAQEAEELAEESKMPLDAARKEAEEELDGMLPEGPDTDGHFLMTIVDEESGENAGFIWTIREETAGRKQSFVCDFAVWEPKRRKGYGAAALRLAEENAAAAGCVESVLFVRDNNDAAKALYVRCGYQVLRQEGFGKYMIKQLT